MVDVSKARELLHELQYRSNPASANGSDPCTISDLKKVIQATSNVLEALISAVENDS
ncbi:hypothetical protein [Oscillibacter ruminantium]|uniref:hypothetical protein n=1 Tax=Oscillibacter ruminantium TaxID=1263547 RepID=UPI0033193BFD